MYIFYRSGYGSQFCFFSTGRNIWKEIPNTLSFASFQRRRKRKVKKNQLLVLLLFNKQTQKKWSYIPTLSFASFQQTWFIMELLLNLTLSFASFQHLFLPYTSLFQTLSFASFQPRELSLPPLHINDISQFCFFSTLIELDEDINLDSQFCFFSTVKDHAKEILIEFSQFCFFSTSGYHEKYIRP